MNLTLRMQIGAKRVILRSCLSQQCAKLCGKLEFQRLGKMLFLFFSFFFFQGGSWKDFNTSQQLTFTINWVLLPINRRRGFSIWETFQHHSPAHTDWSNVSRLKFCDFGRPCGLIVQTNIMEQFFFIPMQSFYEEISRKKDSVSFIQRDCN